MSHYVKFTCQRADAEIQSFDALTELKACRQELLEQRLIGVGANGIGFGNLSIRDGWSAGVHADGLCTSGGVRFRKELAQLRRRCDSII